MGWSGGSLIGAEIEKALKPYLDRFTGEELRGLSQRIAAALIRQDADDLEECSGFIGDAANLITHENAGAPEPHIGASYIRFGSPVTFDGRRWRYAPDDEED